MDTAQLHGHNRAAIYVRVSSEQQAEGSSPETQERECQDLAAQCGLRVVEVYKDITAYRVRGKLVEPSGTRADRPGLLAMLRDAAAGRFEVIIAWREDRLYRALRVMLNVLEVVKEHDIEIKLVKEQFDAKLAPLKAWVASMELDAIKERTSTGTKARLRAGKPLAGQNRYGYRQDGDRIVIVTEEAETVRAIMNWYIAGTSIDEIRQRLIARGAPQNGRRGRRAAWTRDAIQVILRNAPAYASSAKRFSLAGEIFEIPIDPIIDAATLATVEARRQANKAYPAHNVQHNYSIVVFC